MLLIECANGHKAFTESGAAPGAALACPPGSGCCEEDHDHDATANACPGGHGECTLARCTVLTPETEPCPGGHHGFGIDDCTVCRPVTITVLPGTTIVRPANG